MVGDVAQGMDMNQSPILSDDGGIVGSYTILEMFYLDFMVHSVNGIRYAEHY